VECLSYRAIPYGEPTADLIVGHRICGMTSVKLDDYISDEGLVPTSSLKWEGDQLRLASGDKVWVEPKGSGVVAILRERPDLWQIAKLRVCSTHWVSGRLPLFGVPFDDALRKMLAIPRPTENPVKWVARRMDASSLESNRAGIVASMVAHVSFDRSATGSEITLEMWQIPNIEAETFYIHGIFLPSQCCFTHLDGATMYHDEHAVEQFFAQGKKAKGSQKEKYFRLDGPITVDDVRMLGAAFLPLEDLSAEYLYTTA
jgi:hypothetical protein